MIRQNLKHTIFGKPTVEICPTIETNSKQTVFGKFSTQSLFTELDADLYRVLPATGMNDPDWIIAGSDISSSDNFCYTGATNSVIWSVDPVYIAHDGITGAIHGEYYGLKFYTDNDENVDTIKYSPDIVIKIWDKYADFGLTGYGTSYNVFQGPAGATGLSGTTGVGYVGTDGPTGAQGVTGPYGGPAGVTGIQGETGIQGVTGPYPSNYVTLDTDQGITGAKEFYQDITAYGIQLDTSRDNDVDTEGNLHWDSDDRTASLGLGNGVILQIGQEIHAHVKNESGDIIENGKVVYVTGSATGEHRITVAKASAANQSANYVVGIATEQINDNASGLVTNKGLIHDVNTGAWAPGTILYLSDTPGELTDVEPTGTSRIVALGVVVYQDTSEGVILTDVRIHYSLSDLSLVSVTGAQVGDILIAGESGIWYNSSTGMAGSGATGVQGETGIGYVGSDGITGLQGITGLSGVTGLRGLTGLPGIGETGLQGTQGSTGIPGIQGNQGVTGLSGEASAQGATGIQGITGLQGQTGIQGIGETGLIGETGIAGTQGQTGLQGITGIQGQTGITGSTGLIGLTGLSGTTGIRGVTGLSGIGETGLRGVTGLQGTAGSQGETGLQGTAGSQGVTGLQGSQGATGLQGIQGDQGNQGNTGLQGTVGSQGTTGLQGATGLNIASGVSTNNVPYYNGSILADTDIKYISGSVYIGTSPNYININPSATLNFNGTANMLVGFGRYCFEYTPNGTSHGIFGMTFGGTWASSFNFVNSTATEIMGIEANVGSLGVGCQPSSTVGVDINFDNIRIRTSKTPTSASATGSAGTICWDSNYVYVCVATNTWKRATLATW